MELGTVQNARIPDHFGVERSYRAVDELVAHLDRSGKRLGSGRDVEPPAVLLELAANIRPKEHQRELPILVAVE